MGRYGRTRLPLVRLVLLQGTRDTRTAVRSQVLPRWVGKPLKFSEGHLRHMAVGRSQCHSAKWLKARTEGYAAAHSSMQYDLVCPR
jgi:hypothetical protein